ncbi:MAG: TetR/AcrR family transcriptional regulator C-terminal domain-containing protein [Gemmatimonadaceae bacterium]|nr:TetR/AcrR family transcriptional regulator C-terminal domain-containing protein [Gemmatimonadaceae bacterium]
MARKKNSKSRTLTHDDIMHASVRVDPELRRRSELLWEDRSPSSRGPKAGFTPDEVALAAVEIADADGLSAVTMNAVATRLGLTTMAIYRYFPNKETLLDAVIDAGTGSPPRWTEPRDGWRGEVVKWSLAKRALLCSRPWLAELPFVAAPHGPNWLSWLEAITNSLARTGLSAQDVGGVLSIVDGYTRGASDSAISLSRARAQGITEEQWAAGVGADLGRAIGDPRFPNFAAVITAPSDGRPRTLEESFLFGLERVMDGIESYVNANARPKTRATDSL